ncbi:MAG: hypothetical protein NTY04_01585, partial [Candidatus Staskawiczbacteria bacterium]|nr:hypothetical protein [Candidatus Staskawiczbacteria bacterium]
SLTPAQYAERQVGHCLFYLPSKVGTKRVGEGKGARSVSVFREGGYLVMQNKKDQKRGGGEEVHSYLVAFLNDASDNRCNGRFERTLRACSVFRPPVYIDPAWAVGHGCPRMEGTMGKVRFDIAVTVQRAYQHWAGAAEQSSEVEEGGEQATEQSGEKQ